MLKTILVTAAGVGAAGAVTVAAVTIPEESPTTNPGQRGGVEVVRVIDGDTVDVAIDGSEHRIRLLNVDTPEKGTCLSEKATRYTSSLLPEGGRVTLGFDKDRNDPYGRTLAVVMRNGHNVSVELARRGLGFPVNIKPNGKYFGAVRDAADSARKQRRGMFSPRVECTPVSRLAGARSQATQAGTRSVTTQADHQAVVAVLAAAATKAAGTTTARYGIAGRWFARYVMSLRRPVMAKIVRVKARKKLERVDYLRSIAPPPRPEPPPSAPPQAPPAQAPPAPAPPSVPDPPANNSDDSSGGYWPAGVPGDYTGPRCYEPGGVVWRPC